MQITDDRSPRDHDQGTHTWLVVGTDSFLSGWGKAKGGASVAAWACSLEDLPKVEHMKRVRVVNHKNYRPKNAAHFHIYVVRAGHPALEG